VAIRVAAEGGHDIETDDDRRRALLESLTQKVRQLSDAEIASLCEVGKGLLARRIPMEHQAVLIAAGLARQAPGGFMLTDLGKAAADVARDRTRGL
jgi:hypothetical protein